MPVGFAMMTDKLHLMIKVARLYYEDGLTQLEIARRLRLSRPTISRIMQDALAEGVVNISITKEPGGYTDIERKLEDRFGLLEVLVTKVSDPCSPEVVSRELGMFSAGYLHRILQDGDLIGFTWGTTLAALIDSLPPQRKRNVTVLQMVGGLGEPGADTHATDLVRRVSQALGATLGLLPAPGIVKSVSSAQLLKSEPYIARALERMTETNIALAGIGAFTKDSILMSGNNIITWDEIDVLRELGAVGEIALHFYDIYGNPLNSDIEDRIIGVDLETLQSISRVVAIAGGVEKFDAILGAIRGRFINTLITDSCTAEYLLEET
jgi:DNA-binding transcriptional regulator LsrR (DeoR family)